MNPRSAALLAIALLANTALADTDAVSSPDGLTFIRIAADASNFSISRRGESVIASSPLGLDLDSQLGPLTLEKREDVSVDRVIPLIATKAASARDHYRGATLTFRETTGAARRLLIDVRAYDDGVAFRYRVSDQGPVNLRAERTAFVLAGDPLCIVTPTHEAHEALFERKRVSQLRGDIGYDMPLVCATPSARTHFALMQANLHGYSGASLWKAGEALQLRLSPVPKRSGPIVVADAGLTTAWRVVMMSDRAGDMIASPLVGNLNPSPDGDFSWVKPGKAAWDWWSGPLAGVKPDNATYRRFIDFASASGFPYYLMDAGWSWGAGPCCEALPSNDVTRAAE
jgi:alpha-glucosidase